MPFRRALITDVTRIKVLVCDHTRWNDHSSVNNATRSSLDRSISTSISAFA